MIAVPIGPDARMLAVAATAYFEKHGRPETREAKDASICGCRRMGGLYAWEFEQDGRELKVRVDGQLIFSSVFPILTTALDGLSIGNLPQSLVQPYLDRSALEAVLTQWSPSFPGYHLYYPTRRQPKPAFAIVLEALRYGGEGGGSTDHF
jgi:DNA-binding transcriptional LysR family regulator